MQSPAIPWALAAVAVALVAVPAPALATHMGSYSLMPTERDDQGRVDEPDRLETTVLTAPTNPVRNCVASPALAAQCTPDALLPPKVGAWQADVVAPGCADEGGRQLSGLCGLYSVGAGNSNVGPVVPPGRDGLPLSVVGEPGRNDDKSPGRLTPFKGSVVRFLDGRVHAQASPPAGGVQYLDVNHKMADSGLGDALGGIDGDYGQAFVNPGGSAVWALYGLFQDKNGNGVVDFQGTNSCENDEFVCEPDGGVLPSNEFRWIGTCRQFNDRGPTPTGQQYCVPESLVLPVWVYPGNHHAICYGILVAALPVCGSHVPLTYMDWPGRQAACFVDIITGSNLPIFCAGDVRDMDSFAEDDFGGGDPLLDEQTSVRFDNTLDDRTGDALDSGRQYAMGGGWSTYFYDQSLLVTTTFVYGVTRQTTADPGSAHGFALDQLLASDVDRYATWSPDLEELLLEAVKPAAREQWTFARGLYIPLQDTRDAIENSRLFYDQCDEGGFFDGTCPVGEACVKQLCAGGLGPTVGPAGARAGDPGFAREPNHALDVLPGAVRRVCSAENGSAEATFRGSCNLYAGHRAGHRAWIDVQSVGSGAIYTSLAWRTPFGQCVYCVVGPPSALPSLGPGHVREEGDHTRVLQPGSHVFDGVVGAWRDRAQVHDQEQFLDVEATLAESGLVFQPFVYAVGPDGWVGDVVNTTGALRSRGYAPLACNLGGIVAVREYAECNPYLDGNVGDPQGYAVAPAQGGEFCPAAEGLAGGTTPWKLRIVPEGGTWRVPVFVWRSFDTWTLGETGSIQEFTGQGAIEMSLGLGPGLQANDVLILPQGNLGQAVTTEVAGTVVVEPGATCPALAEAVRDIDAYGPWGPQA